MTDDEQLEEKIRAVRIDHYGQCPEYKGHDSDWVGPIIMGAFFLIVVFFAVGAYVGGAEMKATCHQNPPFCEMAQ